MIDPTAPATCRPCGSRGIVTLATYVRNDDQVQNWYLCDRHAALLDPYMVGFAGGITQLPNAPAVREETRRAKTYQSLKLKKQ